MFLNANTPEELRSAVAVATADEQPEIDLYVRATIEAQTFARGNNWLAGKGAELDPRGTPKDLDHYFAEAVRFSATLEDLDPAPEPGRAVIVKANGKRRYWYCDETDIQVTNIGESDRCHRCSGPDGMTTFLEERKPLNFVFHIARGIFAVEFAVCDDCAMYVRSLATGGRRTVVLDPDE